MRNLIHYLKTIMLLVWSIIILHSLPGCIDGQKEKTSGKKYNILFIAVDDMNDWISLYDGPINTPNLEKLASKGIFFDHAYCSSPACNPSRIAVMTGLSPSTTGVYGNKTDWRKALPDAVTISQHFMNNGYWTEGAGKIFHHHYHNAFHDDASFHRFLKLKEDNYPEKKLNDITNWVGGRDGGPTSPPFDWGPWSNENERPPDVRTVDYTIKFLNEKHEKPFFFAAGIYRPHSPWFAPQEYFDSYPLGNLILPEVKNNDLEDLPPGGIKMLEEGKPFIYETITANDQLKEAIQAYQACATFADEQIGRILDALQESPYHENTLIVLWSDHGFHLGEKEHWEKFALWEKTTRTPFIVAVPGMEQEGRVCHYPVSLLDIYPTLIELCDLETRPEVEGNSLLPLLENPDTEWNQPAIMTYGQGNHAVRSQQWRYIQYADGSEELYDHRSDPHEWFNLAADVDYRATIQELKKWLPASDAYPEQDMEAWRGDYEY
jgi:arylsulfatase A-like enzyme